MNETRWVGHGSAWPEGHRQCLQCEGVKPNDDFHRHKACKGGFNSICKSCRKPRSQTHYINTARELRLFAAAKSRAKAKDREFDIELSDIVIPTNCPVLGISMKSPSLDRIDSSKGYVKGNVRVISTRANTLKNNASIQELELVLKDLKALHPYR